MQLVINNINMELRKKDIKNLHINVLPPNGDVVISSPLYISDEAIIACVRLHLPKIKKNIALFKKQERASERQYVSGETMYLFGSQYFFRFVPVENGKSFEISGHDIILKMPSSSTVEQRERFIRSELKILLKEKIEKLLPKWSERTGLYPEFWDIRYMNTRWGTCFKERKRLHFNLQLVQKPVNCLEYVILHELIHFKELHHNDVFKSYLDMYMPHWRETRQELNDCKLDYFYPRCRG